MKKKITHDDYLRFLGLATLMAEHNRATKNIEHAAASLLGYPDPELADFFRTHIYDALHGNRDPRVAMKLEGIEVEAPVVIVNSKGEVEIAVEVELEEPAAPFKCGDVVRHKSGGPPMTIDSLLSSAGIACVWFDSSGSSHRGFFDSADLEHTLAEAPNA